MDALNDEIGDYEEAKRRVQEEVEKWLEAKRKAEAGCGQQLRFYIDSCELKSKATGLRARRT